MRITINNEESILISKDELNMLIDAVPLLSECPRFIALSQLNLPSVSLTTRDILMLFLYSGDDSTIQDKLATYSNQLVTVYYGGNGTIEIILNKGMTVSHTKSGTRLLTTTKNSYKANVQTRWAINLDITATCSENWVYGSVVLYKYEDCSIRSNQVNSYYTRDSVTAHRDQASDGYVDNAWFEYKYETAHGLSSFYDSPTRFDWPV